jgi:hypothetical protein
MGTFTKFQNQQLTMTSGEESRFRKDTEEIFKVILDLLTSDIFHFSFNTMLY